MRDELLGTSVAISAVREQLARLTSNRGLAGQRRPPVLLRGETGTGKGLIAGLLHRHGPRAGATFVDVNCAAIPETLLEAELFGYERGAFTDARQAKPGLLQVAHRGTLFLDEIGLMPAALQAKLLKALEERMVRRLGSTRAEPADPWLLSATSEDLTAAIEARQFREDLYHRLAVVSIHLPALRDRGSDIVMLARHYLARACNEYGVGTRTLSAEAEAALVAYPWPGNVRELANVMERAALLSDRAALAPADLSLPASPRTAVTLPALDEQLADVERDRLHDALQQENWNVSRAAARLGLPRNTLRYRMQRHGLEGTGPAPRRPASRASMPAVAPSRPSTGEALPTMVRWETRRVTMVRADIAAADADTREGSQLPETLAAKVYGFGGRVLDVEPAAVRAAFGLEFPENAARYAAHAALAWKNTTGRQADPPPQVVITVHAADMLVGQAGHRMEIATDARLEAERELTALQMLAAPGDIVISDAVRPLLAGRFALAPIHTVAPPAWRITGLSPAADVPPLVARARELALLEDLLAQGEQGRGHAVLLTGEPGIGKSRLLLEFRRRSAGRAAWLSGSAANFGASLPLHPLLELLRDALGIRAEDNEVAVRRRIDAAATALGDDVLRAVPFLRALLSVGEAADGLAGLDPKLRRAGLFDAIRQFLLATSRTRPLIVVLEDLHWADQETAAFVPTLVDGLASAPLLLCVTMRSGHASSVNETVFGTRVTLARLPEHDATAVACAALDASALAEDVRQLLDAKTDGNPFFVEELVRSLEERGLLTRRDGTVSLASPGGDVEVPDRVEDVILERLGRLSRPARDLLHVAAIAGREFPRRVLEQVTGMSSNEIDVAVQELIDGELVTGSRLWPEVVYAFKHALTQDVAYRAQQPGERAALHGRIGRAIETAFAERLGEHFGILAHHFEQAGLWAKALEYLLAAAEQAERSFAAREGLLLNDRARTAAERAGGGIGDLRTLIRIHEAQARLYFVTSEFARSAAEGERILPLARLLGDRVKESEALAAIAWASTWDRHLDAALRAAHEALAVAAPAGATAVEARAHFIIGWVRAVTGVLDESDRAIQRSLVLSRTAGDAVHQSLALTTAGLLRNWEGAFDQAAELQQQGLQLARDRGLLVPLLFNGFLRGLTLVGRGDYDEAFDTLQEGLAVAERAGDEAIHHRLLNCLGWLFADLGDLEEAERLNTISAHIGQRRRDPGTQPNAELNLADIHLARGDMAVARELYDGVFKYWKAPATSEWMRFRYSIRMFASMGELALATGDLAAARSHARDSLELATRTGSRKNLVKARRLTGKLAAATGDTDRAEADLRQALAIAASIGNPVQHWHTALALADLLQNTARPGAARAQWQSAFDIMQRVGSTLRNERLRRAFAANPDVARVRAIIVEMGPSHP
jgi:transcriptional regulator with AAA-type ATPase domain/tetratricopeptide (TPR) repeat protein